MYQLSKQVFQKYLLWLVCEIYHFCDYQMNQTGFQKHIHGSDFYKVSSKKAKIEEIANYMCEKCMR